MNVNKIMAVVISSLAELDNQALANEVANDIESRLRAPGGPTRSTNREADERFFHFRNVDMQYENGRTVRDVTAFIRRLPDGTYAAAFAECDERDAFCRTRGRTVARRKWFAGKRSATFPARPSYEELLRTWTGAPEPAVNKE